MKTQVFHSGSIANQRVLSILGQKMYDTLIPVHLIVDTQHRVAGYISKTIESGSVGGTQKKNIWYCYVNKRPINAPK